MRLKSALEIPLDIIYFQEGGNTELSGGSDLEV